MARYKLGDIDNEKFYTIPKSLFTNPTIKNIGVSSKIIYAILKDRMELSAKNGWSEDNGDIFFLFGQEELAEMACLSPRTVATCLNELKEVGLIDIKRQGLNKANKLYLNKLPSLQIKTCNFCKSGDENIASQQMQNLQPTDTERSNTKRSKTEKPKSSGGLLPFDLVTDEEIKALLMDFREVRKIKKAAQTVGAEKQVLNRLEELSQGDRDLKKVMLGEAIANSWKTVYPPKQQQPQFQNRRYGRQYTPAQLEALSHMSAEQRQMYDSHANLDPCNPCGERDF